MKELWGEDSLNVIKRKIMAIEELCIHFKGMYEGLRTESEVSRILDEAFERNETAFSRRL